MTNRVRHNPSPVLGLLLCSGFCALIYQTAWFRAFRLVFGASTAATAAVLAVFMAGLGIGSAILGRRADRAKNPLKLYAQLELLIAISTAVSPLLIMVVRWAYLKTGGAETLGGPLATITRLVLSLLVLAPPTVLMGGTLPAAARAIERRTDEGRFGVSALYGVNTIGAVLGTLASNFLLLEVFGTRLTLWLACLLNLLVAVIARAISRGGVVEDDDDDIPDLSETPDAPKQHRDGARWFAPIAAGVSGGVFMLMELVWYRMLAPLLGGSSYTFGLILATALLGIGLGGIFYSRSRVRPSLSLFAISCAVEALMIAIPFALGDRVAILALLTRPLVTAGFGASVAVWTTITFLVVLPAAIISGAQFPLIIGLYGRGAVNVGRDVGAAYFANTVGSIIGSIAGGFGLIPALMAPNCWRLVVILLCLTAVGSLVAELRSGSSERPGVRRRGAAMSLVTVTLSVLCILSRGPSPAWRHSGIGAGRADQRLASGTSPTLVKTFLRNNQGIVTWEEDGLESTVAVGSGDGHAFVVNGKSDGHAIGDGPTQVMSGMIGALLHPNPERALVVGLGTGSTAGWLAAIPSMQKVDVVELEAATLRVAKDCIDVNQNVLANPKVHITLGDGREALLTSRETYDVIFSEPSNPYRAGISSLYTTEFYSATAERLRPGGYFIQWVQAYEVDAWAIATVLVTIHQVYPHLSLWQTMSGDMLVVAQREAPAFDLARIRQTAKQPIYRDALRVWKTDTVEGAFTHFIAGPALAETFAKNDLGLINEDDLNVLEFAYARSVGHHKGGAEAEILNISARLNVVHPPMVNGALDPAGVLEERWLYQASEKRPLDPPPSSGYPPPVHALGLALQAHLGNNFGGAFEAYVSSGRQPTRYLERSFVAEWAVRANAPNANAFIDQVHAPSEQALFRAILAFRRKEDDLALRHLEEGLTLAGTDAWIRSSIVDSALHLTTDLAERRKDLAPKIFDLLGKPLAAESHRDLRYSQRVKVGALIDPKRCAEAVHALEPVPYVDWLMDVRVRCYRAVADPLLHQAEEDLAEYTAMHGEFGGAFAPVPGAEPAYLTPGPPSKQRAEPPADGAAEPSPADAGAD